MYTEIPGFLSCPLSVSTSPLTKSLESGEFDLLSPLPELFRVKIILNSIQWRVVCSILHGGPGVTEGPPLEPGVIDQIYWFFDSFGLFTWEVTKVGQSTFYQRYLRKNFNCGHYTNDKHNYFFLEKTKLRYMAEYLCQKAPTYVHMSSHYSTLGKVLNSELLFYILYNSLRLLFCSSFQEVTNTFPLGTPQKNTQNANFFNIRPIKKWEYEPWWKNEWFIRF